MLPVWMLLVIAAVQVSQSMPLPFMQERNNTNCTINGFPSVFKIFMTLKNGTIHRDENIVLELNVPSNMNFPEIVYTVHGDINGIGPGLDHEDGNAPPSQAELESGIGQLKIAKVPASMDDRMYVKTLLRQPGLEIRCVNTFAFGQTVKSSKNFIGSTAEQDVLDAETSQAGLSTVAVIGIVCGSLGGLLIGIIIGAFIGVKYQLKRQKIEIQLLGGSDEKDSIHLLKINNLENQLESNEIVSISLPTININNSTNTGTFIND